jgi:REP element-mobilizing transposase RayT
MARALRIQYPGACYHVTCRGNERKKIFIDSRDEKTFLGQLALSLEIYNVSLLAYVCMPNHFHLLATTPEGNLSEFMRHFNISYTSAFNRRHKRVGHLYQGRYKAFLIGAGDYLLEVSRYIHLNPVRIKAFLNRTTGEKWSALLRYTGSSLAGYFSLRKRKDFVNYKTVLDHLGGDNRRGRQAYREFIIRGIEQGIENPLELGRGHGIVGALEFVEWVKEKFLKRGTSHREQPALKALRKELEPQELIERFARLIGKSREEICRRGKKSMERAMLMELLYRFCPITQPGIGKLAGGIDYSAVSQARKRLRNRLADEPKLRKMFEQICDQLLQVSRGKI